MEPGEDGGSTFLRVDEFNESNGQVGELELSQQSDIGEQSWTGLPGLDGDVISDPPTADPADTGKPAGSRSPGRPTLQRDQWAPVPQHPPPAGPADAAPEDVDIPTDSLSLAQLRRIVQEMPRKEATPYAFEHQDTSSFEEEVEELFDYSTEERDFLVSTFSFFSDAWQQWLSRSDHHGQHRTLSWASAEDTEKRHFIQCQKDELIPADQKHADSALHVLCYLALGCWRETREQNAESVSENDGSSSATGNDAMQSTSKAQVATMKANIALIADEVGLSTLLAACRTNCTRVFSQELSSSSDAPPDSQSPPAASSTPRCCFTLMYLCIDLARRQLNDEGSRSLVEQCHEIGPAGLQYLTGLLAELRWNDTPSLPLPKVLALFWKTILLTFGSTGHAQTIKAVLNEDLKEKDGSVAPQIRASPLDYHLFRQEITSKYPAFNPPQPLFPFDPDTTSMVPPLQEHGRVDSASDIVGPASVNGNGSSILHQPVHIATPAPSPPPSPAGPGGKGIKKQNYQTNQLFPFLYPPLDDTSNSIGGKGNTELQDLLVGRKWEGQDVPTSILEAADIFASRMRASRAMKQLWDERVKFIKYERGYLIATNEEGDEKASNQYHEEQDDSLKKLDDEAQKRLGFVEDFYAASLPKLQSVVIVLLKVLLQTVTTLVTQPNAPNGLQTGFESPEQNPPERSRSDGDGSQDAAGTDEPVLHGINNIRSQEIMGKSVAGILLALLKWFKLSHILKFEYLTQLLLDSNYIQLILKLFTHQELERAVSFKCEKQSMNFFSWCQRDANPSMNFSPPKPISPPLVADPDDAVPPPIPRSNTVLPVEASSDESAVEADATQPSQPHATDADELRFTAPSPPQPPITDYSWRAFFTAITHLRVLQKIVKNKPHRQLLMVQYKYSQILKKSLKIPEPTIRLYTLKIIKGQVPYSHRKWRQSNMRIITAIYLHCKPELRDDWLAGLAPEEEVGEALPQEQALRSLTYWYNLHRYPGAMSDEPDKVRGLLEEEQDFFMRELEGMDAAGGMGDGAGPGDAEVDMLDVSGDWGNQDRENLLARTRELVEQGEREYAARNEERNVRW